MGKIVKAVVGVALIGAAFLIPGLNALAAAALISGGLSLTASAFLGPAMPKMPRTSPTDRLAADLNVTTPRKWSFGNTALATDIRYQAFSGSSQEYLEQIICVASHKVNSIYELWLDNEKAWDGSSVLGRFSGYLTVVTARTEGTNANGIAIDGTWTSSCTLTGCAYLRVRYKLTGNSKKQDSPFANGPTSRMTIRGKGAYTYDPRLDSTVTGGSGSHRANDQTTWTWDDNGSRNPALQVLWFLLGWKINSKLAVGMGLPPARIDLPSFIAAANVCDESVTLNGGGTEPRYRSDGVLSEGDDRGSVLDTLCANMNAMLRDSGGKIALSVIKNDLGSPVAAFTEADIIGDELWSQTPPLNQTFNICRGRRVDPSDTALYQMVDFPEVSLTSPDGIARIDSVDYMLCQSNGQAQRLAKQRLQRNQYQGRYSAVFGPRAWQVSLGDVVTLSHAGLGFSSKLFRVVEQAVTREGPTKIELVEENSAIYAWANNETAAVTPGSPIIYDPTHNAIVAAIGDATLEIGYGPDNHTTKYSASGTAETGELSYDLNYILYRNGAALASGVTWTYTVINGGINSKTSSNGAQSMTGSGTGTLTVSTEEADRTEVLISATYDSNPAMTKTIVLEKAYAAATSTGSGSGDTPSKTSGWTAINSTTFTDISGTLTFTVPTGQTSLTNTVSLFFKPDKSGGAASWTVEMKVQRNIASVWTDQGATFSGSTSVYTDPETGQLLAQGVTLSGTRQSTGLTAGVQYQERIVARLTSGTRSHNVTGNSTMAAP